jgi:molybdate transport system regulatory protein
MRQDEEENDVAPEGAQAPDPAEIEALGAAFRRWHKDAGRPATRRARAKALALYLLLRHTGAKLSEVLELDLSRDVNLETGTVAFSDRETALSEDARHELAGLAPQIVEKGGEAKLGLDPGYARRIFARLGGEAGLARELCNPSALRRYRAIELAMLGAPETVVRRILGRKPLPGPVAISERDAAAAAQHYARREVSVATSARNSFFGKVERILASDIQSLVELRTVSGSAVAAIITNASVAKLRLAPGAWITALVKAPWVIVVKGAQTPATSAENALPGRVMHVERGEATAEIVVELEDKSVLCALAGRDAADALGAGPGDAVWALFSAHAVILSAQ